MGRRPVAEEVSPQAGDDSVQAVLLVSFALSSAATWQGWEWAPLESLPHWHERRGSTPGVTAGEQSGAGAQGSAHGCCWPGSHQPAAGCQLPGTQHPEHGVGAEGVVHLCVPCFCWASQGLLAISSQPGASSERAEARAAALSLLQVYPITQT